MVHGGTHSAGVAGAITVGLSSWRSGPLVLHMPDANDRYQRLLIAALNESGVSSGLELQLTRSATLNLLLAPLTLALARLRGTRIVHLHYLFKYSVRWAKGGVSRRILRGGLDCGC